MAIPTVIISVVDQEGSAVDKASVTANWTYSLFSGTRTKQTDPSGVVTFSTAAVVLGTVEFTIVAAKGLSSDSVNISIPPGFVGLHEHTLILGFNPVGTVVEKIMGPINKTFGQYSWAVPALVITIILVIGLVVYSFLRNPASIVKQTAATGRQIGREIG